MDSDVGATGVCPAPPPPPPPPVSGQVPALRISTENSGARPRPLPPSDPYEPPAAIQNAMLTKDKKPFTYTPGMGGKLDLSQIRSPRMARRVAKNANDEGIEGPPKTSLEPKSPPSQAGANIYIQPQVAVPVFPANMPNQPVPNKTILNNINRAPAGPPPEKIIEPTKTVIRIEPRQVPPASPSSPDSPTSPTQVLLMKAPTPWMTRTKSQDEDLPEWARRTNKSQESSPEIATSPSVYVVQSASPPPPPQRNQPQNFANHRPQQRHMHPVGGENHTVRIEDRPSVFSVKNDPVGHHQFKNSAPQQQQQRWGQPNGTNQVPIQIQAQQRPQVQYRPQEQVQVQPQRQSPSSPRPQNQQGSYIVPMVVEGRTPSPTAGTLIVQSSIPSQTRIIPIQPQSPQTNPQRNPMNQAEPGPIQSKSFRVLQKITSTDTPDEVDGEQLRKLQLTEDDRMLMNKFKEHVDSDNYLHQEEEPRFRGAAIPSRAFRYLQNMTDAGEITSNTLPRTNNALQKKQNRNSRNFDEVQVNAPSNVNVPASEQQVAEPKKYQGSAIPSRSFRILQAMTDPQSIGPDTTDY